MGEQPTDPIAIRPELRARHAAGQRTGCRAARGLGEGAFRLADQRDFSKPFSKKGFSNKVYG